MANAFGIVAPSKRNIHVEGMQDYRPLAAFSFLGRYRIIDFPISCMSNSGIDHIQVYVTSNPRSLAEHLGSGRHYNINSKHGKLQLLFSTASSENDIYNTDVRSYMDNIEIIQRMNQEYVVIAPSYMVFAQDYDALLNDHIESGADISLLYQRVDNAKEHYLDCDVLTLNKQKGVLSIEPNLGTANNKTIFMDTYVMKKDLFINLVKEASKISSMYTLSQIISEKFSELDVRGIQHKGFCAAVTDLKSYFDANLDLIKPEQAEQLFNGDAPIYTRTTDSCPTKYCDGAVVRNSLISNGCTIKGTVENSVIGRGVNINEGAVVRNCVILAYSDIGKNVELENQVIDKWAKIGHEAKLITDADKPGYIKRNDVL